ncbi:MAG: response regulator transcription factor [Deltaproteobacteria bacterium]|nr:response regulator transcription factor [Deltaproteobacteria bacterium]
MTLRLLHIDDDARFAALVADYLTPNGFQVTHCPDGGRGLAALEQHPYDAVLLDVMMPGLDGLEVCRRIRARYSVPVLMLTARGDETDRVVGLELGADDYLPKPCSPRELLARLRAVLRRAQPDAVAGALAVGDLTLDITGREVRRAGARVELTGIEFDLLVALARRAGRVISRDSLLALAGRDDVTVGERTVDVHVSHLRAKLGDDPKSPRRIKTVRGVGYVLVRDDD